MLNSKSNSGDKSSLNYDGAINGIASRVNTRIHDGQWSCDSIGILAGVSPVLILEHIGFMTLVQPFILLSNLWSSQIASFYVLSKNYYRQFRRVNAWYWFLPNKAGRLTPFVIHIPRLQNVHYDLIWSTLCWENLFFPSGSCRNISASLHVKNHMLFGLIDINRRK